MFKTLAVASLCAVAFGAPSHPLMEMSSRVADTQDSMIAYVNSLNVSWTAGRNANWKDHTWSTIKHMCGAKKGGPRLPRKDLRELQSRMEIPTSFDPRTQWPNCPSLKEVRDQAACGSCWAFGAVEAMTDRVCIASNGAKSAHYSAEDMNSCCSTCGDGCDGGYPESAWEFWASSGLVTGANYDVTPPLCMPYTIPSCDHHLKHPKITPCGNEVSTPPCKQTCVNGDVFANDKSYGNAPYSLDMSSIYAELMTHGPIETSFTVYADFPSYTGGVYVQTSDQELGGHAVKLMGWGVLNNVDYWIVANSWNPDWGMDGFFLIRRGTDECGIEDGFVAGLPKA